ncbi:hypothetical protein RND81_09G048500 [Saponaria officinalis]|uniref:Uncharacterized protein n=1 Tax=Saponaria officinalis TaxID=3572 RepID=A0AAW1IHJ0_SAPOF
MGRRERRSAYGLDKEDVRVYDTIYRTVSTRKRNSVSEILLIFPPKGMTVMTPSFPSFNLSHISLITVFGIGSSTKFRFRLHIPLIKHFLSSNTSGDVSTG